MMSMQRGPDVRQKCRTGEAGVRRVFDPATGESYVSKNHPDSENAQGSQIREMMTF